MRTQAARALLESEIDRGRAKFPGNRFMVAALIEELGELSEALLDDKPVTARKESIQCAAISMRIAEELDSADYKDSPLICAAVALGRIAKAILQRKHDPSLCDALDDNVRRLRNGDPTFLDMTDIEAQP